MISIRPDLAWFTSLLLLVLIVGCERTPETTENPTQLADIAVPDTGELPKTASTFIGAKKALYDQVCSDRRMTFYCGCEYSPDRKIDLESCGLKHLADKPTARRIEAEHILPAANFGNFRSCWRNPSEFPKCVKSSGKAVSGRECCQRVDPVFEAAHNDLFNLVPSVGGINRKRSNYSFGMIEGEKRIGECNIEVDSSIRRAEPPESRMGDIARVMFYMEDTYGFRLSNQDRQLFTVWSRQDPPDDWEIERSMRIARIQGRGNRFVDDYGVIFGKPSHDISRLASDYQVVIIGERHRFAESPKLMYELAERFTANGECITVALEITSDQTDTLESAETGTDLAAALQIHPIIDSPHMRTLINDLSDLTADRCLNVTAVDAPTGVDLSRDQWIADRITDLATNRRVLALLGNLHAMKQTRWTNGNDDPHAAEILGRQDVRVLSVMQDWPGNCDSRTGEYINIKNQIAATTVKKIISVASVLNPADFSLIADGVVIWRC